MEKPKIIKGDKQSRREFSKWHYAKNREKYLAMHRARNAKRRGAIKELFLKHKAGGCVDCGEKDPIVLDFDHRPGELKCFGLGDAASNVSSIEKLEVEIAKCDVRCANCHRRITHKRRIEGQTNYG